MRLASVFLVIVKELVSVVGTLAQLLGTGGSTGSVPGKKL